MITAVEVTSVYAANATSLEYQNRFADAIPALVVGKAINEVKVSRVASRDRQLAHRTAQHGAPPLPPPTASELYEDWNNQIDGCVARLRALAGTNPDAPDVTGLVDELKRTSSDFARLWEDTTTSTRAPTATSATATPMSGP